MLFYMQNVCQKSGLSFPVLRVLPPLFCFYIAKVILLMSAIRFFTFFCEMPRHFFDFFLCECPLFAIAAGRAFPMWLL